MLDEPHQHFLAGVAVPRVTEHDGGAAVQVQRAGHLVGAVGAGLRKAVDGHQERDRAALEVVDRREAVLQAPGVGQDDGAQCALRQVVPQEPEAVLPRGAEEVEGQALADGDAAEVHRHRGGALAVHSPGVVDRLTRLAEPFLRTQRVDLADRAHQGCLAHAEAARD